MIRGAVYRVDLGHAKRGHEQRGRRLGLVLSPTELSWSVVTVIPTSTTAHPAIFRPTMVIDGVTTRLLVDQIRSLDTQFVHGDPIDYLLREDLAEVEHAVMRYLGLG